MEVAGLNIPLALLHVGNPIKNYIIISTHVIQGVGQIIIPGQL